MSDAIPPWIEAQERLSRSRRTKAAQSEIDFGGSPQINSGRFWHSKRDVKKFDFLFENRQTDGKTITINALELAKIVRDAVFEHSFPAMRLDFSKHFQRWILVRESEFEDMHTRILELEGALEVEQRRSQQLAAEPNDSM